MKKLQTLTVLSFLLIVWLLPLQAQVLTKAASPESVGMSAQRLARMDAWINEAIEAGQIPGAVSLIARKGKVVQHKIFGYQDVEAKEPMKKNTLFYIQSMTKPIVTVAAMMLYEEGHFELNDPVRKYLPQFENPLVGTFSGEGENLNLETKQTDKAITIAQLMSHTAGMLHGLSGSELDKKYAMELYYKPHKTIEDRVNALAGMPLVDPPGNAWHYSASPDVLALLIEKFSGMTAREFLHKRIFEPLGMQDTDYNVVPGAENRVSKLYASTEGGKIVLSPRQVPHTGHTIFGGTHGLYSTAEDYMRFCQMMLNRGTFNGHQLLGSKTVELMTINQIGELSRGPGQGFGLGFGVTTDLAESKRLGSEGMYYWSGAYSTFFFIDPKEELVSILMLQLAPYNGFYGRRHQHFVYQAIVD